MQWWWIAIGWLITSWLMYKSPNCVSLSLIEILWEADFCLRGEKVNEFCELQSWRWFSCLNTWMSLNNLVAYGMVWGGNSKNKTWDKDPFANQVQLHHLYLLLLNECLNYNNFNISSCIDSCYHRIRLGLWIKWRTIWSLHNLKRFGTRFDWL